MRSAVVAALLLLSVEPGMVSAQSRETPLSEGRRAVTVQGERYGTLADENPVTLRVRGVFQKIVRAAGRRPGVAPEVHVLDTPRVIAEALPGGLVVVSRGFVDLARADENALAFILAHEVAHLVRDHHGVLESLGLLGAGRTPGRAGPTTEQPGRATATAEQVRAYQTLELEADRLGVLFAALAGYQTSAAVPILLTLIARTGPDAFHPDPKERAGAIREQLAEVSDHLEVFHAGLFLLAVGRYLEAARVLEHFLGLFPSREVLSTVGVAYHKEALRWVPPPEFQHLLVIDPATRAPMPRGAAAHPAFRPMIERALHYYTLAVDADPTYAPAANNLGAAYLDLGERELALGYINRALREDATLAAAYNNRALASIAGRDYPRAEEDLLRAARLAPGLREVAVNLARLYETLGRADEARRWQPRARPAESLAREHGGETVGPVSPGAPLDQLREWIEEPRVRQIRIPLGAGASGDLRLLVLAQRGVVVLARNNAVDAVGILPRQRVASGRGVRAGDAGARVEAAYGAPSGTDGIQALNVWGYPARALAVLLVNDRVQTVWVGRPGKSER